MREAKLIAHDLRVAMKEVMSQHISGGRLSTDSLRELQKMSEEAVMKLMEIGAVGTKK